MATKKGKRNIARLNPPGEPFLSSVEDPWIKNPEFIRRFIKQRPDYEQLCDEVAYTLTKFLKDAGIKIAAVTSRAKTLESFLEKVGRKSYSDPFVEVTDFSGARVICFYPDDLPKIEALIRKEFEISEKEDKVQAKEVDRFGYSATHFLVRLSKRVAGARYDDLKDKICEIQVRTVLQDAWAIFSHHLMYKHEDEIPDVLKREIHALAGAMATADTPFQAIRDKRDAYIKSVKAYASKMDLEEVETNLDSVKEYLSQKFPQRKVGSEGYLSRWFYLLNIKDYPTLNQVDNLLNRTERARDWYFKQIKPETVREEEGSATELIRALGIMHPDLRETWPEHKHSLLQQAERFVEK